MVISCYEINVELFTRLRAIRTISISKLPISMALLDFSIFHRKFDLTL